MINRTNNAYSLNEENTERNFYLIENDEYEDKSGYIYVPLNSLILKIFCFITTTIVLFILGKNEMQNVPAITRIATAFVQAILFCVVWKGFKSGIKDLIDDFNRYKNVSLKYEEDDDEEDDYEPLFSFKKSK